MVSSVSSNQNIFEDATNVYPEAPDKSGYGYKLKFNPRKSNNNQGANKRKRTRNVTWFNPPFSDNVATNIGKKFFRLLDKCFPPGHQFHQLLNRNTIKLSYSCMPNVKQIISSHNKMYLRKQNQKSPSQRLATVEITTNAR